MNANVAAQVRLHHHQRPFFCSIKCSSSLKGLKSHIILIRSSSISIARASFCCCCLLDDDDDDDGFFKNHHLSVKL